MKKVVLSFSLVHILACSFRQKINALSQVDSVNKKMDSIFQPNKAYYNPTTLDGCLRRDFPGNSSRDGRWVYYPSNGNIRQIIKPEISKIIPFYSFYQVTMTNYLGYHVNAATCLILYDSLNKKIELVEPLWYSDESELFLKFFTGANFSDSISLLKFVYELQDLMIVGTSGKFSNMQYQGDKISFNLTFGYVSESPGIVNTVTNIWRTFEISLNGYMITGYKITNPKMNQSNIIK